MQGSLAERLRVLRAQHGLSLKEASEKIGVNRHTLRDLELGKREPYGPTLRKIAEGYNVPIGRLLEEEAVPLDSAPKGQYSEPFPGLTSAELRAPRETVPLGDVVSDERQAAFWREIDHLYAQLQAGHLSMPEYRARRDAEFKALFAAIERAGTEAG